MQTKTTADIAALFPPEDPLYNPWLKHDFVFEKCFLTGTPVKEIQQVQLLSRDVLTKYKLEGTGLKLLDGTTVPYEALKLPATNEVAVACALLCQEVEVILLGGAVDDRVETQFLLFRYATLLFYAILYQEYFSAVRSGKMQNDALYSSTFIPQARLLHLHLQSLMRTVNYIEFKPFSLFSLTTWDYPDAFGFDIKTGLNTFTISLRMGGANVQLALLDQNVQERFFTSFFQRFDALHLHPIQCDELFARMTYKAYLAEPRYQLGLEYPNAQDDSLSFSMMLNDEDSLMPVFRTWEDEMYVLVLANYLGRYGYTREELFHETRGVITFLEDGDGDPLVMDLYGNIVPKPLPSQEAA